YAEELWLATPDHGVCASLYCASAVSAKVGKGSNVMITEETDYPFGDSVTLTIATPQPARFPLYLRIPRWCARASLQVNRRAVLLQPRALSYAKLERQWKNGDTVRLELPKQVSVRTWEVNRNSASIDYGPLTFSLKIGEKWTRSGTNEAWPEWEVFPTTPWNYGLELEAPENSFIVVHQPGPLPPNPFTPDTAPLELRARARKIPAWHQDKLGLVGQLQPSPVKSNESLETVSLIPMGAARLRLTCFPVIGHEENAHTWTAAPDRP